MTDIKTIEYWKERLAQEENERYSDCGKLRLENGRLLAQIDTLIRKVNLNEEQIARTKWHWWYQIHLAERVLKKFKLKSDIYSSKKATEYWRKYYMQKRCKVQAKKIEELCKDKIIGYLMENAQNSPIFSSYMLVVADLQKGKEND